MMRCLQVLVAFHFRPSFASPISTSSPTAYGKEANVQRSHDQATAENPRDTPLDPWDIPDLTPEQALYFFQPEDGYYSAAMLTLTGEVICRDVKVPEGKDALQRLWRQEYPLVAAAELRPGTDRFFLPDDMMPKAIEYARSLGMLIEPPAAMNQDSKGINEDGLGVSGQSMDDQILDDSQSYVAPLDASCMWMEECTYPVYLESRESHPLGAHQAQSDLGCPKTSDDLVDAWNRFLEVVNDIDEILGDTSWLFPVELPDLGNNAMDLNELETNQSAQSSAFKDGNDWIKFTDFGVDYSADQASTSQVGRLYWPNSAESGVDYGNDQASTSKQTSRDDVYSRPIVDSSHQLMRYDASGHAYIRQLSLGPDSQMLVQDLPIGFTQEALQSAAQNLEYAESHTWRDVKTGIYNVDVNGVSEPLELVHFGLPRHVIGPAYDVATVDRGQPRPRTNTDLNVCRADGRCEKRKHDELR